MPARHAVPVAPDEPPQDEEHQQVPQRLVQERRHEGVRATGGVVGERRVVDLDRPRLCAGAAVQLLVEVVAPAAERLGQDQPGGDAVGDHPERQLGAAHADQRADHPAQDGAPDAQSALPDLRDLAVVPGREGAPVGDHVVEAGADQAERHRPHRDRVDQLGIDPAAAELFAGDPAREQHRERQDQSVPARPAGRGIGTETGRRGWGWRRTGTSGASQVIGNHGRQRHPVRPHVRPRT